MARAAGYVISFVYSACGALAAVLDCRSEHRGVWSDEEQSPWQRRASGTGLGRSCLPGQAGLSGP